MSTKHRFAAMGELWRRYSSHFAFFWARRHEMTPPKLKPHEAEFLPAALALQTSPVSPAGRWVARILMGMIGFVVAWSILGEMDIIVMASGKVIPSSRTKTIASVETARVAQLFVKENQAVKAGDLLIELDTRLSDGERDKASDERGLAQLQVARAQALLQSIRNGRLETLHNTGQVDSAKFDIAKQHLRSQWEDYFAKRQKLDDEIKRYESQLPLIASRIKDYQELVKNNDVPRHALLDKLQEQIEVQGKLSEARNQRAVLDHESRKSAHDVINEAHKQASSLQHDVERAGVRSDLLRLTAPVDGTVQQLNVHTVGGVVAATQPLMVIVPEKDDVEIEAYVENRDIGFVQVGQEVSVKLSAFEYTKFGMVQGRITHVARDAIAPNDAASSAVDAASKTSDKSQAKEPLYPVRVLLGKRAMVVNGQEVPIIPGMSASIEVKTGARRIISYFLSPLIQNVHESMNER